MRGKGQAVHDGAAGEGLPAAGGRVPLAPVEAKARGDQGEAGEEEEEGIDLKVLRDQTTEEVSVPSSPIREPVEEIVASIKVKN